MTASSSGPHTVAGCLLGGVRFAVATEDVQQLLACPSQLIALPRRAGALVGAVPLRDATVPVVDLRHWLSWPGVGATPDAAAGPEPARPALLLVLRQGEQRVAVGVDAMEGLRRVGPAGSQVLAHGDGNDELFSCVVQPLATAQQAPEAPVALLDVAALMRLSQAWTEVRQAEAGSAQALSPDQTLAMGTACALMDCEGEVLAVPADQLCAVVPMPPLQALWGGDASRVGVARWRGRDVPVLRVLASLGVVTGTPAPAPLLAVVAHADVYMGIPVQAANEVRRLDLSAAQGVAALGLDPASLESATGGYALAGVLTLADQRRALLLDVPTLVASDPMAALSAQRGEAQGASAVQAAMDDQAYVVVRAGGSWALPLSQVLEILHPPENWTPDPAAGSPWRHTWRQRALPLWDLRALLGQGPCDPSAATRLLVLQQGDDPLGLVVEELLHLIPARTAERHRLRRPDGREQPFLVHRLGGQPQSFALLAESDWQAARLPH